MSYFLHLYTYIESLPCPKEHKCGNHSVCVVDPLFPDKPDCKCDPNYKKSADGKRCEGMLLVSILSLDMFGRSCTCEMSVELFTEKLIRPLVLFVSLLLVLTLSVTI